MAQKNVRWLSHALGLVSALTSVGCTPQPEAAPPSDALSLRDVLALGEDAAAALDADARAYWRHRIDAALDAQAEEGDERPAAPDALPAAAGVGLALAGPMRTALTLDAERSEAGKEPLVATAATTDGALHPLLGTSLFEADGEGDWLVPVRAAIAAGAGTDPGDVLFFEAPGAPFAVLWMPEDGAAYVNPVLRALRDGAIAPPAARAGVLVAPRTRTGDGRPAPTSFWGDRNPYRFYSSISECAAAEQARCEGCLAGSADQCTQKLGGTSGADECSVLGSTADGYTLACIMYAYSMATVSFCMSDAAPACAPPSLDYDITALEEYRGVITDPSCLPALDTCITPYRDGINCGDPCDEACSNLANACVEPCTSGLDACSSTASACGEVGTGCGNSASSCGDSCSSSSDACSSSCDSCSSSCAVVRPLPPRPLDPTRPHDLRARTLAGLRNIAALLLPPLILLVMRRRLPRKEVRP
jgi:hypothetical protein